MRRLPLSLQYPVISRFVECADDGIRRNRNLILLDERPSLEQKIARHIIYDLSRLTTRFLTEAPNGIDRVDLRLAKYFAFARTTEMSALMWAPIGPRLYSASIAQEVVQAIEEHWREPEQAHEDPLYERVVQRL